MDHVIAETRTGKVRGITQDGVAIFKGIPYGGPTTDSRRFAPPTPPQAWSGVRDAIAFGPRSFQDDNAFAMPPELLKLLPLRDPEPMSEDCLVLNVWTPAVNDGRRRPVMFWCHGGAFIVGSGASPWYDGANLARKGDVVVVTINHRLNVFGFLHLDDLGGGEEFAGAGNAGMLDIVLALEWVRDNIASFGGDPANVTIFGESGGGAKVCILMAMPAARGLFHKAIVQSGPVVQTATREDATATARAVLEELGLGALQLPELRRLPAAKLNDAQAAVVRKNNMLSFANRRRLGFNPVADGVTVSGPFAPTAPALAKDIPLMIGTTKDEMHLFFGLHPAFAQLDEAAARTTVKALAGPRADRIFDLYRQTRPAASLRDIVLAIATDCAMRIPSLTIAERKVDQHGAPVYVYLFTRETPVLNGKLKSPHALDIPYVFDNVADGGFTGDSPDRFALADRMSRTWMAFARTGNPNNSTIPDWPAYDRARRPTFIWDKECRVEMDPYQAERTAWND